MDKQSVPGGIVVQTQGEVLDGAREYARRQFAAFARRLPDRLQSVRVTLTTFARLSAPVPALAQANLEVDGHPVRAQVAASFVQEASGLLKARLRQQVTLLTGPRTARPWPAPAARQLRAEPRPAAQRRIVRRKSVTLTRCTPEQAALTMDVMDYDVHLFVDADTGEDSVVYRVGPTGYRLARLTSLAPPTEPVTIPLTINVHPVPRETPRHALERLNDTELAFRFFHDLDTGRGAVLYRRYDGHYGQITPE